MNLRVFFLIILNFLFIGSLYANHYYANIEIDVRETGEVTIDGITNLNYLMNVQNSQLYTSKSGNFWILNITTQEVFEDFIYELLLPKYADINYIKTTPTFRIAEENNRIKIIGTGENRPLSIVIQYKIDNMKYFDIKYILGSVVVFLVVLFVILRLMGYKFRKESSNKEISDGIKEDSLDLKTDSNLKNSLSYDYSILPQRQKDIIDILREKGKITQKELEGLMDIPKSSVSRNLKTLEIKKILKKEQVGKTNYLSLYELE